MRIKSMQVELKYELNRQILIFERVTTQLYLKNLLLRQIAYLQIESLFKLFCLDYYYY